MMTFDWFATWRNAGLSWPAPERPAPCMAEPNGRERKTIGRLNPCPDCKRHECWLYYLRLSVATVYRKKEEADEDDGRPSGWLEATGTLTVGAYGIARIAP